MPIKSTETSFLATTSLVAWTEFVELTGIGEDRIRELMDLGWLQPARQTDQAPLFRQIDVYKTRKVDRLCEDFELTNSLNHPMYSCITELMTKFKKRPSAAWKLFIKNSSIAGHQPPGRVG